MSFRVTTDNPDGFVPFIDGVNPGHPDIPTFKGGGDICQDCGAHGQDHLHVRYDISDNRSHILHYYICPHAFQVRAGRLRIKKVHGRH